jgi:hypothetical protein
MQSHLVLFARHFAVLVLFTIRSESLRASDAVFRAGLIAFIQLRIVACIITSVVVVVKIIGCGAIGIVAVERVQIVISI